MILEEMDDLWDEMTPEERVRIDRWIREQVKWLQPPVHDPFTTSIVAHASEQPGAYARVAAAAALVAGFCFTVSIGTVVRGDKDPVKSDSSNLSYTVAVKVE